MTVKIRFSSHTYYHFPMSRRFLPNHPVCTVLSPNITSNFPSSCETRLFCFYFPNQPLDGYILAEICSCLYSLNNVWTRHNILHLVPSQYPEGPATGHLNTGFSWFPCVYKRMLRWFPSFQVATTCFSCSPPDLNFLVFFIYLCACKITTATGWQPNCS